MKFACPTCKTRYNIANEKVPVGVAVRFTCKKCSNVIRLRRKAKSQGAPASPEAAGGNDASTRVASLREINKLKKESKAPVEMSGDSTRVAGLQEINALKSEAAKRITSLSSAARALKVRT